MSSYVISIICVSIVGTVVSILSPDGEGGGLLRHVRLIFGLCLVIVCINPIMQIIESVREMDFELITPDIEDESDKYYDIFEDSYSKSEIANLKSGIKQMLYDKFSIDPSECEIAIILSDRGDLNRISVTLYGGAVWKDTGEIENYLYRAFGCEIVSIIG